MVVVDRKRRLSDGASLDIHLASLRVIPGRPRDCTDYEEGGVRRKRECELERELMRAYDRVGRRNDGRDQPNLISHMGGSSQLHNILLLAGLQKEILSRRPAGGGDRGEEQELYREESTERQKPY